MDHPAPSNGTVNFTLTSAAKAVGRSKSTILRAIKSGRISADYTDGVYAIAPAELFRVYQAQVVELAARNWAVGEAHPGSWIATQPQSTPAAPEPTGEIAVLRELVEELRNANQFLRGELVALRERLDRSEDERRKLSEAQQRLVSGPGRPRWWRFSHRG